VTLIFPLVLPVNNVRAHEPGLLVDEDEEEGFGIFKASLLA
jgi:hypothetical protein